ncbi:penicillin-binding protein 2 [mine drainage metagenome]|uniref:Penicillin-binding protein 2 n=1 Tax=mine drainage metagenome TaxID=410659 RepID=A0A1J5QDY7_9ZZZZ
MSAKRSIAAAARSKVKPLVLQLPAWRRRALLVLVLLGFGALIGRSVYLQGMHNDFLQQKGDERYSRALTLSAHRGMVTDRYGEPLAISTPVESIWASPPDVSINAVQIRKMAELLDMKPSELSRKFSNSEREFVYLKRRMPPEQAAQVMQLGVPGIFMQREYRRYYPAGEVMAHVVGFTGVADNGQEGLELVYQDWLSGKPGSRRVIKDRQGHIVEDLEAVKVPQDGHDLRLSVDRKIQYLAYRELTRAVEANKAKAGSIVVLDAKTGEVLAMANQPTYNPNNPVNIMGRSRNRAITDTFEPGSTMKPFTMSAVFENESITPETMIDVGQGSYVVGKSTIHDEHAKGLMSVAQILQKSSNIGTAKMGMTLKPQVLWSMYNQVGFGSLPHSGFPGEVSGRLRPWKHWVPIDQATMCFGQGMAVTLLQLARAYTVFANDGELKPISMVKINEAPIGQQVMSAHTAHEIRDMLELVVQPGGTAPRAQVAGYRVAGKTGTAQKVENGQYAYGRYVASFIGMAPASNPRLIIAVMIDEPNAGTHFGGMVAAPVFSKVMEGSLRLLAVPQDAPTSNVVIPPANAPEVPENA